MGIDGCRAGWVAVVLDDTGIRGGALTARLGDLLGEVGPVAVAGVDVPIGNVAGGRRRADAAARGLLGPRRASVFTPVPAEVLHVDDYGEANRRARATVGYGISAQAWRLRAKLLEAEALRDATTVDLREVHPEVSFRTMAGAPLAHPKRSWAGLDQRLGLLAEGGVDLHALLATPHGAPHLGAAVNAGIDDVVDAAAVAWTARRIAVGAAASLPDPPERDHRGRAVAIWR